MNKKGSEVRLFVGEKEATGDELRDHCTELIKKGHREELLILARVTTLIQDYRLHKEKKPLHEAVRNEPELFQSRIFREFIADILDGSYKPIVGGTMSKATLAKAQLILDRIKYFKNMRLPVYYSSAKRNNLFAVQLTADRLSMPVGTVEDTLKKRNRDRVKELSRAINRFPASNDGLIILGLNKFQTPQSEDEISNLEEILQSLNDSDRRALDRFFNDYRPELWLSLDTKEKVAEAEENFNKRDEYKLLKRLQRKTKS